LKKFKSLKRLDVADGILSFFGVSEIGVTTNLESISIVGNRFKRVRICHRSSSLLLRSSSLLLPSLLPFQ
jgi:hypothetical protein